MSNKGKKSNKLKRKRGKKFKFQNTPSTTNSKPGAKGITSSNPFDNHSISKKAMKDKAKVIYKF